MRIIFMGSPAFAVPTLDALVEAGHEIVCVYTQPPRPAGRGKADRPTAVEERARSLGLDVRTPKSLRNEEDLAAFAALEADIAVVAAYGLILPQAILDAPRHGCLNVHGSLLPRWRGAAPVQRAIMAGDQLTGVMIMQMEAGLDTGPMLAEEALAIGTKSAAQVTEELAQLGARLMVEVLADLAAYPPTPQPEDGVTYAAKISKDEARIDWRRPASDLVRHIQGLSPFPGAWFQLGDERVKILAADPTDGSGPPGTVLDDQMMIACGVGALRPSRLQRAGKAPLPTGDLLRGYAIPAGTILS